MLTEGARRATGVSIVRPLLDSPTVLTYKKEEEGDDMEKNRDNEVRKRHHLSPEEKFQIVIGSIVGGRKISFLAD